MMRMLLASAAFLSVLAASQQASAYTRFNMGVGNNFGWGDGNNSGLWGGISIKPPPGPNGPWGSPFGNSTFGSPFGDQTAFPNYAGNPPAIPRPGFGAPMGVVPPPAAATSVPGIAPAPVTAGPELPPPPMPAKPVSFTPYPQLIPGLMPYVDPWSPR